MKETRGVGIRWDQEEDEYLRDRYPTAPDEELTKRLGRTMLAIRGRAHRLKIRRSGMIIRDVLKRRAHERWNP